MKCAIFINAFAKNDSIKNQVNRIKAELELLNVTVDVISNINLLLYTDNNGNLVNKVKDYNFIIYLDKDKYISKMLELAGYRLFNSSDAIEICDDKMLTHLKLANSIRMPKTITYPLCYTKNEDYESFINQVKKELKYPFLIKENYGSLGKQVYLINNDEEFLNKEKELQYKPHIFQEFIKESSGIDYRVFVIGGEVIAAMKRVNETNYVSNIASGGKGYVITPEQSLKELAIKAASIIGLDYCGCDFVKDKVGNYLLIEVNSNAFFNELEKVTGINVAKKYAEYLYKKGQ